MQPQDENTPKRDMSIPTRNHSGVRPPDRTAAAQLMRQQIDSIYDDQEIADNSAGTHNPYQRTLPTDIDKAASQPQSTDWKRYHSAWQSYYQQYYERYYLSQLHQRQQAIKPTMQPTTQIQPPEDARSSPAEQTLTKDQAVNELREKLINEVKERSHKVRKSRHFMPLVAAITVALVFGILQYNRLIIAQVKAYVSPGSINPQNIIIDPTANTKAGPEPRVVIPKINVEAPVVYDVPSLEENLIQSKLKDGVVHYPIPGANSMPGQAGNTVILGHSSNDVFDDGDYKFVFVQLDKLEKGDTYYLNYQGTRYTYRVTEKKVIDPTEVSQLIIDSSTPLSTLVTCTPPGTALKRLVVIGEQISPDPSTATAAAPKEQSSEPFNIAGNSKSLLERLFSF